MLWIGINISNIWARVKLSVFPRQLYIEIMHGVCTPHSTWFLADSINCNIHYTCCYGIHTPCTSSIDITSSRVIYNSAQFVTTSRSMISLRRNVKLLTSQIQHVRSFVVTSEHAALKDNLIKLIEKELNPHCSKWEADKKFPAHDVCKILGSNFRYVYIYCI